MVKYNDAIKLLRKCHKENRNVTYTELENVLELESGSIANSTNTAKEAIRELRNRLKTEHGLTFHTASSGRNSGPQYQHYVLSTVKTTKIEKKENKDKVEKVSENSIENIGNLETYVAALRKNNEKLYQELEEVKLQNKRLIEMASEASSKEEEYKKIIHSLMNIAGIV